MGRPSKPAPGRRTHRVLVYLSDDELDEVMQCQHLRLGISRSTLARIALMDYVRAEIARLRK